MKTVIRNNQQANVVNINEVDPDNRIYVLVGNKRRKPYKLTKLNGQFGFVALHNSTGWAHKLHSTAQAAINRAMNKGKEVYEFDNYQDFLRWAQSY